MYFFSNSEGAQFQQWTLQRSSPSSHAGPQIANILDAGGHVPQREGSRSDLTAFQLFPGARRGYGRTGLRTNGVRGGVRRAPAVTSRINKDPHPSIDFVKFLCEVFRIAPDQERPNRMRESSDFSHVRLAI